MDYVYRYLFSALWLGWVLCWIVFARNVKATVQRESWSSRLLHVVPLLIAMYLLWADRVPTAFLNERILPPAAWPFWVGAILTASGLLFTVWARVHLGRNWSGTVTIKQGHELITSGPYAFVRHPIYTGLLLALFGSAIARAEWRGVLGFALASVALWRKLRSEEHFMRQQFGKAYQAYSERVAALIPFVF